VERLTSGYRPPVARRVVPAASVALAIIVWAWLGWLTFDAAGASRGAATASTAGQPIARPDPCRLVQPVATGFDRHCDLEFRGDGGLLEVAFDESWQGTVLTQRVAIGSPSSPLWSVIARGAPAQSASRITQLGVMPAGEGEHLVYTLGNCAGTVCGSHDVVVVGEGSGSIRELHRERLGRAGSFELRAGLLVLQDGPLERAYTWDGAVYRLIEVRRVSPSTASPSPR